VRLAARLSVVSATVASLVLGTVGAMPATAATGTITCTVSRPAVPLPAIMDTPISGNVVCTHSAGLPVSLSIAPFVKDIAGPFVGKLVLNPATGDFTYTPGFYPPDPATGRQDRLPEYTGSDQFTVIGRSSDGASASMVVPITIQAPPRSCDQNFAPTTRTMFNDPSGSPSKQYQMLRYLIKMIDCTPPVNPDGSQATIKFSFYSLSYAPVQAALSAAARRGVSVQAITNSHSDKYGSWQELAKDLGGDTRATNFATTCWAGCLTPRTPPPPGSPTAWYAAESTSLTSNSAVFRDRSIPGAQPIISWKWNFGDGTSADGPGPHTKTYKGPGTYKTSLTVTDAAGVTHSTRGEKTVPDNEEPMYPSMHSKIYLFSTVGSGAKQRRWVSGYSSGNPTYYQSRKGFNNLNIAVGDKTLYDIFVNYQNDLVGASRGEVFSPNYFRTLKTPGNPASGARPTTVHLLPQRSGDINREIIKSIKCRYKVGKKRKRTYVRVSMFVFTRKGVAADLWYLAMRKGCNVEIVYTQMSQRLKGANGKWLTNKDGEKIGYGAADCLATPPTKIVVKKAKKGRPARRKRVKNSLKGKNGYCSGGTLRGSVPVTSTLQGRTAEGPDVLPREAEVRHREADLAGRLHPQRHLHPPQGDARQRSRPRQAAEVRDDGVGQLVLAGPAYLR
jgi:PKD repeat protein